MVPFSIWLLHLDKCLLWQDSFNFRPLELCFVLTRSGHTHSLMWSLVIFFANIEKFLLFYLTFHVFLPPPPAKKQINGQKEFYLYVYNLYRYKRFYGNKELWIMRGEEQFLLTVAQNELYEVEP